MVHELKTDPEPFMAVWTGKKRFELRRNDRNFQVGDTLILRQTTYSAKEMHAQGLPLEYTGRRFLCTISYVLQGGNYGLESGYVVLGISAEVSL